MIFSFLKKLVLVIIDWFSKHFSIRMFGKPIFNFNQKKIYMETLALIIPVTQRVWGIFQNHPETMIAVMLSLVLGSFFVLSYIRVIYTRSENLNTFIGITIGSIIGAIIGVIIFLAFGYGNSYFIVIGIAVGAVAGFIFQEIVWNNDFLLYLLGEISLCITMRVISQSWILVGSMIGLFILSIGSTSFTLWVIGKVR